MFDASLTYIPVVLKYGIILIVLKPTSPVPALHETRFVFNTKSGRLTLLREITACLNRAQNAELLRLSKGDTYSNHYVLNG
jgi:hypothetical protein